MSTFTTANKIGNHGPEETGMHSYNSSLCPTPTLFLSKKRVASSVLLVITTLLHAVSVLTLCLGKLSSGQNIAKQLANREVA